MGKSACDSRFMTWAIGLHHCLRNSINSALTKCPLCGVSVCKKRVVKNPRKAGTQTVRPPSTGNSTPLMNSEASVARMRAALATSAGRERRPSGMVAMNFARFSGVSGTPMNFSSSAVSPITGQWR